MNKPGEHVSVQVLLISSAYLVTDEQSDIHTFIREYVDKGHIEKHVLLKSYAYELTHEGTHCLDIISCHYVERQGVIHFLPFILEPNVDGFEGHFYTQVFVN